jgi:MFS family permease
LRLKTPWYHGWNIVTLCVLLQMTVLGVMANCFSFFLEGWSRDFNQPISLFVLAIAMFSIPSAFLAPLAGWMVERWSASRIMLAGYIGVAAAYALIGFAFSGWVVVLVYALLLPPAVIASAAIPSQTLVSRWFVRRRAFAFSLSALGLVLAGILYPPLVVGMTGSLGWRATWWVFAAFNCVVISPLAWFVLRDRPDPGEGAAYLEGDDHHVLEDKGSRIGFREIARRRNFWLVVLCFVPALAANSVLSNNFAPYGKERGVDLATVARLVATFNVAATVGKLGAGWLADRVGNRLPLLLLTGSAAVGALLLTVAHGATPITVGAVLLGASQGMWVMLAACIASEFGSRDFPRAYGFASAATLFTTVTAPAVAYSAEVTGSYTGGFVATTISCVVGMIAACLYRDFGRAVLSPADEAELTLINRG